MYQDAVDDPAAPLARLLRRHREMAGLTQEELATRARISVRTVSDLERGVRDRPHAHTLRQLGQALALGAREQAALIATAVDEKPGPTAAPRTAFGGETTERRAHAPHRDRPPWAAARAARSVTAYRVLLGATEHGSTIAWGEAPDTAAFVGRDDELATLARWARDERARVIALLGLGGIGKTMLAARLAHAIAPSFDGVFWRGLQNALPIEAWLDEALRFLVPDRAAPAGLGARVALLLAALRERRCLLVLDNWETVLAPGQAGGGYRAGYEGYGLLLARLSMAAHQGCLLLTSRELPAELAGQGGARGPARAWRLRGLADDEGRAILGAGTLTGGAADWRELLERCGRNPLVLRLVADVIGELFAGEIGAFLAEGAVVAGDVRRVLRDQIDRLTRAEQALLYRLAAAREPLTFAELAGTPRPIATPGAAQDALRALLHRSLVERGEGGRAFRLQPVVLDYVTDRLVETVCAELRRGAPDLLARQPLLRAQAKDYARQTQERLILEPILEQLAREEADGEAGVEQRLLALLAMWRGAALARQGHGPGNAVNLLRVLRGHLRGLDLSGLIIQEAALEQVELHDTSLAGACLSACTLPERFAGIYALALSADVGLLAAGSDTGEVRVWRLAERALLSVCTHGCAVKAVAFDARACLLASGGVDGSIKVWDPRTGACRATLAGHSDMISTVALSADGRALASASLDRTVRLWDVASARCHVTLEGHEGAVLGVALDAAGCLVASGDQQGTMRLWDWETGACLATLPAHAGPVRGVALSADGRTLVSGGLDGMVRIWDVAESCCVAALAGHAGAIYGIALSADGRVAASGGEDRTVRFWDARDGAPLAAHHGHADTVWAVALSPNGSLAASGSQEGLVQLWEAPCWRPVAALRGQATRVYSVALGAPGAPDAPVAVAGPDDVVRVWDCAHGRRLASLRGHRGTVLAVALSADGRTLASGDQDGMVRLWDWAREACLATLPAHAGFVRALALAADGRLLASAGQGGMVRIWRSNGHGAWDAAATWRAHEGIAYGVALSEDGALALSGGEDGALRLWDLRAMRPLARWRGHPGAVLSVALGASGRAASAGYDGTIRVWDIDPAVEATDAGGCDGTLGASAPSLDAGVPIPPEPGNAAEGHEARLLYALAGHAGAVREVALSADGRLLASAGFDGTVRLWSLERAPDADACLGVLAGGGDRVALLVDGSILAYGTASGEVVIWDVQAGERLWTLRPDRLFERANIRGLSGVTEAQRATLLAFGAVE